MIMTRHSTQLHLLMTSFKKISYPKMVYESLRNYFSINTNGQLSILYRYILSIVYTLQPSFDIFDDFRNRQKLIASCKWQVGQLTNVLNYLYPSNIYNFTVSGITTTPNPTDTYTNNGITFTIVYTSIISGSGTIICTASSKPTSSGILVRASGSGDSNISFSAYQNGIYIVQNTIDNVYVPIIDKGLYTSSPASNWTVFAPAISSRFRGLRLRL